MAHQIIFKPFNMILKHLIWSFSHTKGSTSKLWFMLHTWYGPLLWFFPDAVCHFLSWTAFIRIDFCMWKSSQEKQNSYGFGKTQEWEYFFNQVDVSRLAGPNSILVIRQLTLWTPQLWPKTPPIFLSDSLWHQISALRSPVPRERPAGVVEGVLEYKAGRWRKHVVWDFLKANRGSCVGEGL